WRDSLEEKPPAKSPPRQVSRRRPSTVPSADSKKRPMTIAWRPKGGTMTHGTDHAALPAVLTGHALRSLRDAGYDFSTAIAEVIDNSIEAEANQIEVFLDEQEDAQGKIHVERVAIADDGGGMGIGEDGEDVLHHYLQLGYSTRYMSKTTIGKYGLG